MLKMAKRVCSTLLSTFDDARSEKKARKTVHRITTTTEYDWFVGTTQTSTRSTEMDVDDERSAESKDSKQFVPFSEAVRTPEEKQDKTDHLPATPLTTVYTHSIATAFYHADGLTTTSSSTAVRHLSTEDAIDRWFPSPSDRWEWITNKLDESGFVGREWLKKEVLARFDGGSGRVVRHKLLIFAPVGFGKSAFIQNWVRTDGKNVAAYYFCQHDTATFTR